MLLAHSDSSIPVPPRVSGWTELGLRECRPEMCDSRPPYPQAAHQRLSTAEVTTTALFCALIEKQDAWRSDSGLVSWVFEELYVATSNPRSTA